MVFSWPGLRGSAMHGDLAEEAKDPCLVAPLVVLASKLEGTLGERQGVIRSAGQQIPLTQRGETT
jgi:hypothetical protein